MFLFLGADPSTEWLKDCDVARRRRAASSRPAQDLTLPLQTSVPGVFAIGDVRAGSVKRVGGAIGEGAAVVAQIHAYLARSPESIRRRIPFSDRHRSSRPYPGVFEVQDDAFLGLQDVLDARAHSRIKVRAGRQSFAFPVEASHAGEKRGRPFLPEP